jgi:hypothetical protein
MSTWTAPAARVTARPGARKGNDHDNALSVGSPSQEEDFAQLKEGAAPWGGRRTARFCWSLVGQSSEHVPDSPVGQERTFVPGDRAGGGEEWKRTNRLRRN